MYVFSSLVRHTTGQFMKEEKDYYVKLEIDRDLSDRVNFAFKTSWKILLHLIFDITNFKLIQGYQRFEF